MEILDINERQKENIKTGRELRFKIMELKKFIIQVGTGIDQHGQDVTKAAQKAVKDATARACLSGLVELVQIQNPDHIIVDVLLGCPYPDRVNVTQVIQSLPFGQKRIKVVKGGLIVHGIFQPELGDTTDEMIVVNAAVTVLVDKDELMHNSTKDLASN